MKNVIRIIVLSLCIMPTFALSLCDNPFDKTELKLPDGRLLVLNKIEEHMWVLSLHDKKRRLLWKKTYSQDFDSLWDFAYFIKVKGKDYARDLNRDGYLEIALSTWDGGNGPKRPAIIFSVKETELTLFKVIKDYPIESCRAAL